MMNEKRVKKEIERNIEGYSKEYSGRKLISKLQLITKRIGITNVIYAEILYYLLVAPTTPWSVKVSIVATLGYVIAPIDLIPDFIFFAGLSDDIAALSLAVTEIKATMLAYVTPHILKQAAAGAKKLFKNEPDKSIIDIINKLKLYEPID